jgi:hypothetical protein
MGTLREEFQVQLDAIIETAERETSSLPLEDPAAGKPVRGRKLKRTAQLSQQESFERLDILLEEAQAGAPDDWLAAQAGVTLDSVLWWRRERNIRHPKGPKARVDVLRAAGFGIRFDSALHAADSDFDGQWESPHFLLRKAINYTEFCRHVYALHVLLGTGPELLSESIGVRPKDIELALAVWGRHLKKVGKKCPTCKELTDPRYGAFCSVRCAEKR